MNDELPEFFERAKPPAAPAALRARVLSAVERELAPRRKPAWERALEWGVAASLTLGIGMNIWQWQRPGPLASHSKPAPNAQWTPRSPLADEQLTDFVNKRLAAQPPRDTQAAFGKHYEEVLREISEHPAG
ncbi:MAG: hypothetical protein DWQ37_12345 [Planctomycetota bacterium]|nr:MAG: hypothetical protein DWQ37_12345 [Planctomycetota bacterium]